MIKFEFYEYQNTPQDQYVKEIVTFKLTIQDEKNTESFYIPYFRKATKEGNLFWGTGSTGVTIDSSKKYIDNFQPDSRSREKSIKEFLDKRLWERKEEPSNEIHYPHGLVKASPPPTPNSMKEVQEDALPF